MTIASLSEDKREKRFRSQSLYKQAWKSVCSRPSAVFGLVIIFLFIFISLFARWIAPFSVADVHLGYSDLPPVWVTDSKIHLAGNPRFPLGTDTLGRDIFSWMIYGTQTSIFLGLFSAPLIGLFGTGFGLISGYVGGKLDNVMMRIADLFYSFPTIMVYILVVMVLKQTIIGTMLNGVLMMFIAILSVGWVSIARLVRGNVMMLRNLEYIEAAQSIGAKPSRIIRKHIFPNVLSTIFVWMTYTIPQIILIESILGYLGIGINGSDRYAFFAASWGGMFSEGRRLIHYQPIMTILPACGVALISLAFTFLGDALRDAFDPRNQNTASTFLEGLRSSDVVDDEGKGKNYVINRGFLGGLSGPQKLILSIFLFLIVVILGIFTLIVFQKIYPV